ncbi:MAG: tetratricopeptide repeat protein [Gammaproteobacteria bacterium]|nr:tetratricopeptide repeat protein [Gammaproteobacteria bacterium]
MKPDLQRGFRLYDRTVLPLRNRITGDGKDAHVVPRTMSVLVCLAEHAGEVVTRGFLDEHVWGRSVVTDHVLTNCISELRNHLGDTRAEPRFIETVPKQGYRLIAPVTHLEARTEPEAPLLLRRVPRIALPLGLALGVVVTAGIWWAMSTGPGQGVTDFPEKSVAVLPFENLSADKSNQYFVSGIQDLIITKLASIGDLKVISRSSTAHYSSGPSDLQKVADQLGVATILEGSVQQVGNDVLINVQLIDARNNTHLWAHDYRRTLEDILGVEGEVAQKIAVALQAELSPAEAARLASLPTTDEAAYDLFLRAEYQAHLGHVNFDIERWKAAIPLYRQAIVEDPGFALAWARLSRVENDLTAWGGVGKNVQQLLAQARSDAKRALQLAPKLAAAHLAIGYCEYAGKDFAAALKAFNAALALSPSNARALVARGNVQRAQGRYDDAIASYKQAFAHDPRNTVLAFETGNTYKVIGRFTESETWLRHALALDPHNQNAKSTLAEVILFDTGDVALALAVLQGDGTLVGVERTVMLTYQRRYREAIAVLKRIPDTRSIVYVATGGSKALRLADLYRLAGDKAKARQFYKLALSKARAQLARLPGGGWAWVWQFVARAELGLGHTAKALEAVAKARELLAGDPHRSYAASIMGINASLYAGAGRPDLAVPLLTKTLEAPTVGNYYSPVLLWLDPDWDPIRNDPRFQALLEKYKQYKPAVNYGSAPASTASSASTR